MESIDVRVEIKIYPWRIPFIVERKREIYVHASTVQLYQLKDIFFVYRITLRREFFRFLFLLSRVSGSSFAKKNSTDFREDYESKRGLNRVTQPAEHSRTPKLKLLFLPPSLVLLNLLPNPEITLSRSKKAFRERNPRERLRGKMWKIA